MDFLVQEEPEVVYVGTGYEAALPITENAQNMLKKCETVIMPTPRIIEKIEHEKQKTAAIIQVT